MYQETKIRELISNLWTEPSKDKSLDFAIELANELLLTFGAPSTSIKTIDEALENAYPYSHFKNQKMESWFEKHRFYGDARTAFRLFDDASEVYESSFYWMNESSTKSRIAATTLLGSNWEDSELTMKPEYKLGIDFYLNHDANALLLVVSKKGNVRVLEFSERFTHTQKEIIEDLINVFNMPGIDMDDPYEPQRSIHEKIWSTLKLNTVNKAFYRGIADLFEELSAFLKVTYSTKDSKDLQLFSSRLLGRLLFVWFLRKKNIIDETHGYFDYETISSTDYYNQKLKLLFFDTLNNQIADRSHNDKNTPFLNGGLFENHENDFYNEKIDFPNNYFNRLYEHLNKYNFTVDESTPEYEQIAIDPEMLGRVFENLLASIVPETSSAANERKNKGAFYTPREIVSYMCKESLKEHIKTKLNDESLNGGVDMLIDMNDAKFIERKSTGGSKLWGERSVDTQKGIIEILNEVKIFDPACGSGAFPMGMLQLISQTYDRLVAKYDINEKKHVYASGKSVYNKYESKLNIIKYNLYGSDIEPMAIEIARLRSWLSLIIEEDNEVHPLPNLDFNFVCSNTLIKLDDELSLDLGGNEIFEENFNQLRDLYFDTHSKKSKDLLKEDFQRLFNSYTNNSFTSKRIKQLSTWNPFDISKPAEFFDAKTMFNVEKFDLIIANPPYIGEKGHKALFNEIKGTYYGRYYQKNMDYFYFFFHMALDLFSTDGIITFITTNYFITADGALTLRKAFYEKSKIYKMLNFNNAVIFDSAKGQHDMITMIKHKSSKSKSVLQYIMDTTKNSNELFELQSLDFSKNSLTELFYDTSSNGNYFITFKRNSSIETILNKIGVNEKLEHYCNINQGIITGADKVTKKHVKNFPYLKGKLGDGIYIKDKSSFDELEIENEFRVPWFKNSDINRWSIRIDKQRNEELLYFTKSLSKKSKIYGYLKVYEDILKNRAEFKSTNRMWYELHRTRNREIFYGEKIVAPQRSYFNLFGYTTEPFFASADVYFITMKRSSIELKYILGVLNSKLAYIWLYFRGKRKGEMLELYRNPLSVIPIIIPEEKQVDEVITLVNNILSDEKDEISKIKLDSAISEIYGLSNEEITVVNEFYNEKNKKFKI